MTYLVPARPERSLPALSLPRAPEQALGPQIRRHIIEQSWRARVGHIGSALSIADMVGAVFSVLGATGPDAPDRDRFVLSKGHAALALYAALSIVGTVTSEELRTFCADNTRLGVHPSHSLPGVDFSTGSLGQGIPMAVGAALAGRMLGSARRVIAIASDAECNEGSVWEAAMFGAQHRLANLTVLVDHNHQQAFGQTAEILSSSALMERWGAFGWHAVGVDGHDEAQIRDILSIAGDGAPRVLIAETVFGKGVSFMEGRLEWHYLPMSDEEHRRALAELDGRQG